VNGVKRPQEKEPERLKEKGRKARALTVFNVSNAHCGTVNTKKKKKRKQRGMARRCVKGGKAE